MRFPIVFQSLEQELGGLEEVFKGKVLNAGCGDRDLSGALSKTTMTALVNVDIKTNLPGAYLADLRELPFEDGHFDCILCNAVLEHHPDPPAALLEMVRVLKPGGNIILCIPFLQPYHPCPEDYYRYTATGMITLGKNVGLNVVQIREVHTIIHTLSWIIWEYITEKRYSTVLILLYYPFLFLTKLAARVPPRKVGSPNSRVANAYQVLYRK
jgi:SAM-dependent methyltransferase